MIRFLKVSGLLIGMAAVAYGQEESPLRPIPIDPSVGCTDAQSPSCGCPIGIPMSASCGQCSECPLPECGICGTGRCWDCSDEEGTDVESLTVAAQSKKLYEHHLARIKVQLPESSAVWLHNQRMTTAGEKRTFVVPISNQDKSYQYEVKIDFVSDGKKYFKKFTIEELRAGMIIKLVVKASPATESEDVKIEIKDDVEAVGGVADADNGDKPEPQDMPE